VIEHVIEATGRQGVSPNCLAAPVAS